MKIGIDVHGVITKHPKFFSELTHLIKQDEGEVHILTGSSFNPNTKYGRKALDELKNCGIYYTHLFSIIDHHEDIGTEVVYEDSENPWIDGELWDKAKAEYCKENRIDIMFDDTQEYGKYFSTPFVCFHSIVEEK